MLKLALKIFTFIGIFSILLGTVPVSAFGDNVTDSIDIDAKTSTSSLQLNYNITQTFNVDSHGIFMVLPYNQGGVKTSYVLESVEAKKSSSSDFSPENYDQIWELDQFRIRIGDKNKKIIGQYDYRIKIRTSFDSNIKYDFAFLNEWRDPVSKIILRIDDKPQCEGITCTKDSTKYTFNPDKNQANSFVALAFIYWPYPFALLIIASIVYLLWSEFARDPNDGLVFDKPEFEPPKDIYPWQAEYLITEGTVNFKNTFLSFMLWLNHKGYIKIEKVAADIEEKSFLDKAKGLLAIQPKSDQKEKIKITILKKIPDNIVPKSFLETVKKMAAEGVQEGLLSSRLNESEHAPKLFEAITQSLKDRYVHKPIYGAVGIAMGVYFALAVLIFVLYSTVQINFSIGNSIMNLVIFSIIITIPGVIYILLKWAKLDKSGATLRAYCVRYRFYLEKAEKYKLDFSNNPDQGVQHYLASVPFAAAFGILPQFEKYIKQILPNVPDVDLTTNFADALFYSSFYIPPSSGSFDGANIVGDIAGSFVDGGGSW
jgi:hypothetical protein